jgi:hypothetical protein
MDVPRRRQFRERGARDETVVTQAKSSDEFKVIFARQGNRDNNAKFHSTALLKTNRNFRSDCGKVFAFVRILWAFNVLSYYSGATAINILSTHNSQHAARLLLNSKKIR